MILVGYHGNSNNYRLFDPETKSIKISKNVIFNEDGKSDIHKNTEQGLIYENSEDVDDNCEKSMGLTEHLHDEQSSDASDTVENITQQSNEQSRYTLRNKNTLKIPKRYELNISEVNVPTTYEQAVNGNQSTQWKEAIEEELKAHDECETWRTVVYEPTMKVIDTKWVFNVKYNQNNVINRFKARLCAKGFAQEKGIDYEETFSPTARYDSIRVLLSIATKYDYEITQFDIKTAFLYGELTEDVYIHPPEGVAVEKNQVLKLNKALYGLKQAPRCWNKKFNMLLNKLGLRNCKGDNCVFIGEFQNCKIFLLLYVDDGLIMCENANIITKIIKELEAVFKIRVFEPDVFIGLQIERDRSKKTMKIHQNKYIEQIINRFNMTQANPSLIPADPGIHLVAGKDEVNFPYREAVGMLIYLSTVSRPDISFAIGVLSRFVNNFDSTHCKAVKKVIRYLISTKELGIQYSYNGDDELLGYCDADYDGDLDTRRSTTGYIFIMNGGPVTWNSQRQRSVALSTTEAEYMAACSATKEVVWLKQLLFDIKEEVNDPVNLFIDNQSAIKLICNPVYHKRTKHIDIQYHFIREKYEDGYIKPIYISSENQLADILTKPLNHLRLMKLRNILCVM
jgi:hypothetical protein